MRKYGLTIDNLVSVDVVTADGEFVKAGDNGERRVPGRSRRWRQTSAS
jgi:FAD/FMN-containing dehydrogenase